MSFKKLAAEPVKKVLKNVKELYQVEKDEYIILENTDRTVRKMDALFKLYLDSFPKGTDPVFNVRTEHDCSACQHFIKNIGWTVDENGKSIWTLAAKNAQYPYNEIFKKMGEYVESKKVLHPFITDIPFVGSKTNTAKCGDEICTFEHFYYDIKRDGRWYTKDIGAVKNKFMSRIESLKKAISEFDFGVYDLVNEMIEDGLYRGEQYKTYIDDMIHVFEEYKKADNKSLWLAKNWNRPAARIRTLAIYTLIQDLIDGVDIVAAEKKYLQKVDPMNYQRVKTTASIKQLKEAKEFVKNEGYQNSLFRKHATLNDIPKKMFLWQKSSLKAIDEIDAIFDEIPINSAKKIKKNGQKITINELIDMINNYQVNNLEVAEDSNRLVYISTAQYPESKPLFPWGHISWTYAGGVADAMFNKISKSVASAGGNINSKYRISLAWYACDDLDLHMYTPKNAHIYYGDKSPKNTNWQLDIDMNAGVCHNGKNPVENIFTNEPENGIYVVKVHQFSRRSNYVKENFHVTLKFGDRIYVVEYPRRLTNYVTICDFEIKNGELKYIKFNEDVKVLNSENSNTEYREVSAVLESPNQEGLKHIFFVLEGYKNQEGKERGFFVEHLKPELKLHKKVFEVLGDKMGFKLQPNGVTAIGVNQGRKDLKLPIRINGKPYILVSK